MAATHKKLNEGRVLLSRNSGSVFIEIDNVRHKAFSYSQGTDGTRNHIWAPDGVAVLRADENSVVFDLGSGNKSLILAQGASVQEITNTADSLATHSYSFAELHL